MRVVKKTGAVSGSTPRFDMPALLCYTCWQQLQDPTLMGSSHRFRLWISNDFDAAEPRTLQEPFSSHLVVMATAELPPQATRLP